MYHYLPWIFHFLLHVVSILAMCCFISICHIISLHMVGYFIPVCINIYCRYFISIAVLHQYLPCAISLPKSLCCGLFHCCVHQYLPLIFHFDCMSYQYLPCAVSFPLPCYFIRVCINICRAYLISTSMLHQYLPRTFHFLCRAISLSAMITFI